MGILLVQGPFVGIHPTSRRARARHGYPRLFALNLVVG